MLKYIACNFNNMMLVNKFYYQILVNEFNFQEYLKETYYKLSRIHFYSINEYELLSVKIDLCLSLIIEEYQD